MHHHIVELQRKLIEARESNDRRIKSYTASARCQKDIESLGRIGLTTEEISNSLHLPITFVQNQKARIAKANEERRRLIEERNGVREPDLDDDEIEIFDECVKEQRQKGKSRIRARRICEYMIMEEREGSASTKVNEARRKFLGAGILPSPEFVGMPSVFSILQR